MADDVVDVVREHPQPHPDLRCREPGAGRFLHRLGEVLDELAQLLVEGGHLRRGRRQHRVAEQSDGLDCHGTCSFGSAGYWPILRKVAARSVQLISTCSSPIRSCAVLVRLRVSVPFCPPPAHVMSQVVVAVIW